MIRQGLIDSIESERESVINFLYGERNKFINETGSYPKILYLGGDFYDGLLRYFYIHEFGATILSVQERDGEIKKFLDIPIFRVMNDPKHINFV